MTYRKTPYVQKKQERLKEIKERLAAPQVMIQKPRMYFAFGSNLNVRDMRHRCPGAVPHDSALVENGRLVFRGVADVACEMGYRVPVGVWKITPENERALDRYEGVGAGFYEKYDIPYGDDKALIYFMTAEGIFPPSQHYVDTIRQGYRDFGLDEKYLDAAVAHAYLRKDPCEQTLDRRERQRASETQRRLATITDAVALERLERAAERRKAT
jgi:hypothetical protein